MFMTISGLVIAAIFIFDIYAVYILWKTKFFKTAPTVPSHGSAKKKVQELVAKEIKNGKGEVKEVADLGAGMGTLIAKGAKQFPDVKFTAYEWDGLFCNFMKIRFWRRKNVVVKKADIMKIKATADVLTVFLMTKQMTQLEQKIKKENWKGKVLIANHFPLPNTKPTEVHNVARLAKWDVFVYRF